MENSANKLQQDIMNVVKHEISKLPKGVIIGAAIGGLLVLTRFKGLRSIAKVVGPYVLVDIVAHLLYANEKPVPEKVVEDVEAKEVK